MMTKKNYQDLAGALSIGADEYGFEFVVDNVADVLAADNPRFDREKFFIAVFGEDVDHCACGCR
jgi:hypothetical protein